jgi:hypothetical protein
VTVNTVFDGSSAASVVSTVQVGFNVDAIGTQPSGFHLKLEQFLARITGVDPTIPMVINRRVVFSQAPINIHAGLSDLSNGGAINQPALLPAPVMTRADDKKATVTPETWQPDPSGSGFVYTLRANRSGVYQLKMDEANVDCGTVLIVQPYPSQVLLVPDLPTRILTLIGILLGLAAIILVIILLICRFVNPQYHHVDIDDAAFNPIPGHQWIMTDTSCWRQKESGTPDVGGIYLITICSVFSKKGECKVTIYYYYVQMKKHKTLPTTYRDGAQIPVNTVSVNVYLNR